MRDRQLFSFGTVAAGVLGVLVFAATAMLAQAPSSQTTARSAQATARSAPAPRTPWGTPDLHGTWFVTEDVPLERSAANAGREFLTDDGSGRGSTGEVGEPGRNQRAGDAAPDVSGAYNAAFNSILKTGKRTSRVIDPPDGRIPPIRRGRGGGGGGGGGAAGRGAAGPRGAVAGAAAPGAPGGGGGARRTGERQPENIAQNRRAASASAALPAAEHGVRPGHDHADRAVAASRSRCTWRTTTPAAATASSTWTAGRIRPPACSSISVTRAAAGKATRWSSKRPTSRGLPRLEPETATR